MTGRQHAIPEAEPRWWDAALAVAFVIGCYCLAWQWDSLP